MGQLDGKVALITGGASGIGRAAAERVVAEGAHVVVCDLDAEGGKRIASALSDDFFEMDVADPARWREVAEQVTAERGGIDLAFLNAGVSTRRPGLRREGGAPSRLVIGGYGIAELEDADYRKAVGANIDGVVFGARAVVPAMRSRGGGTLVVTASMAGLISFAQDPIYTMTKHAVVGLVRALAPALEREGIRAHVLCPAVVDTPILGPNGADRVRAAGIPVMPPSQIAEALLHAAQAEEAGGIWVCLPGQAPHRYVFAPAAPGIGG